MVPKIRLDQNQLYYKLNRYFNAPEENSALAADIARGYLKLERQISALAPSETITIAFKTDRLNSADYNKTAFRRPIIQLAKFAQRELSGMVSHFFVHGSLATFDYAPGFSDLDTFVIIKSHVCSRAQKLKELRTKLIAAKNILKEIDPESHHGFICCNEINLRYYCNAYMPIPVLRLARRVLGPESINFRLRDSKQEHLDVFLRFADILLDKKRFDPKTISRHEFKYFVAVILLLPTLYLQAKGYTLYKKYSFRLYRHPFLDKAAAVRKKFARHTLKQLMGLLGTGYLAQANRMITDMKNSLTKWKQRQAYVNIPRPAPLSSYQQARQELVNILKPNGDVMALYEYGQVGSPGISDLDLIVITQNKLRPSSAADLRIEPAKLAHGSRWIRGTVMIMPARDFSNILFFDDVRLKKIWGQKIKITNPSSSDIRYREIASVIDWLPERLTRLIKLFRQEQLDVHYALLCLKSVTHTLERVAQLTGHKQHTQLTNEVLLARKVWLKGQGNDLRWLIKKAIYAGYEALDDFTQTFFKAGCGAEGELTLFPWQKIIFTNDRAKIDPDWAISFSNEKEIPVPTSTNLIPHFWTYAQQAGPLAAQMRRQLRLTSQNIQPRGNYYRFLKKKMNLATNCANFLLQNHLESGLYRFGFYLQNYLKDSREQSQPAPPLRHLTDLRKGR